MQRLLKGTCIIDTFISFLGGPINFTAVNNLVGILLVTLAAGQ